MDNSSVPIYQREKQGFILDCCHSLLTKEAIRKLYPQFKKAHKGMKSIEAGKIKNTDENRRVTHFTDRKTYVESEVFQEVNEFFAQIRQGKILNAKGNVFHALIINGIGGSALGPQLMQFAIHGPYWNEWSEVQRQKQLRIYFIDNCDPQGTGDILRVVDLQNALFLTISKSGVTRESYNNLSVFKQLFKKQDLNFSRHALAITMDGSHLDREAREQRWLKCWSLADSIGGRTSITTIVGHVPAAAAGINFKAFLEGALQMDQWTAIEDPLHNPSYLLAAAWYVLGQGRGNRNLLIIPYSDRLALLSKYLQQLLMESLGKEKDRDGNIVHQGLNVFGNKGSTDSHAYIQQLNDGRNDFILTLIEILHNPTDFHLNHNLSMGDTLHNSMEGLAKALIMKNRSVIRIRVDRLNEETMGMLIALYERAVAVYAELINVNAFHQPGVEAYKAAAQHLEERSQKIHDYIVQNDRSEISIEACAKTVQLPRSDVEGILAKLAVNQRDIGKHRIHRQWQNEEWHYTIDTGYAYTLSEDVEPITIDGPAASGKSTIARKLAEHLNTIYVDTGMLYRALAYFALKRDIDVHSHPETFIEFLAEIDLYFKRRIGNEIDLFLNDGLLPMTELRRSEVSSTASQIATIPEVRRWLIPRQRELAKFGLIVMDGRDIGTVIFPKAKHKFFINASAEERTRRRFLQSGENENQATAESVAAEIAARDHRDSNRAVAPLRPASDAIRIDTTELSVEEVLTKILTIINKTKDSS